MTGEDDFFMLTVPEASARLHWPLVVPLVVGEILRDWSLQYECANAGWVYDAELNVRPLDSLGQLGNWLRAYQFALNKRKRFGVPMVDRGLVWYEWQELYRSKLTVPLSIAFAFVATHNHFVLDRGGKVFNRSAPVIKFPSGATEDDHLALLGVLNSSTACFWLKQNSQAKAGSGIGRGIQPEDWMDRYEFTATTLADYPLPEKYPFDRTREMNALAHELESHARPTARDQISQLNRLPRTRRRSTRFVHG